MTGRARSCRTLLLPALLLVGGATGRAVGQDLQSLIAPYLAARDRGAIAEVAGEAYVEPRTRAGPREPLVGVSVMLLPEVGVLGPRLDAVKQGWRDSTWSFVVASDRLQAERRDYELALAMAGGGELARGEVSDEAGRFRFTAVPEGRWLLLAWREVSRPHAPRRLRERDARGFTDNPERAGYAAITYWRVPVELRAGSPVSVSLNDRSEWLTVVREELRAPADSGTGPRRR